MASWAARTCPLAVDPHTPGWPHGRSQPTGLRGEKVRRRVAPSQKSAMRQQGQKSASQRNEAMCHFRKSVGLDHFIAVFFSILGL